MLGRHTLMDDLLREFLTETNESLDTVDNQLVRFEQDPNNAKILDNVFRLVHTIKGTCGFLGLPRLEALAHAGETLMSKFRDGMPVTAEAVTLILSSIDRIKEILGVLEATETEPEGTDQDLIDPLVQLRMQSFATASEPVAVKEEVMSPPQTLERELRPGEVSLDELERAFRETATEVAPPLAPAAPPAPAQDTAPVVASSKKPAAAKSVVEVEVLEADKIANQSIRVNVDTLEHLMTMVSELVLTRNQLLEISRRNEDTEFKVPLQRLSNVTAELQEGVMKTRMQPIGNAWQKLPRIVRDLANELSKPIEFEMHEAETEKMPDAQAFKFIFTPGFSTARQVTNVSGRGVGLDVVRSNIDQIGGTIDVKSVPGRDTILGDGAVIMIVDPNGLANAIGSSAAAQQAAESAREIEQRAEAASLESLLVFRAGSPQPKAVHLSLVTRLEEIDAKTIEGADGRLMVQYRGQLMPLVLVNEDVRIKDKGVQPLLVFADEGRAMGLIVDEIVDIVEERLRIELASQRPGVLGSAIVKGQATEVVDIAHYLPLAFEDWLAWGGGRTARAPVRVLLIDDAPFFRNMLTPVLKAAGYAVTSAESGKQALALFEDGKRFDIVVTDLDMPGMDGFDLTAAVKKDPRTASIPVIGLSSLASPEAIERGRKVGLHDYVAKFDRQGLIAALKEQTDELSRAA